MATKTTKSNLIANIKHSTIFLALISLGTFLRYYDLDQLGLRLDETQSIWQASHSLDFIIAYMAKNVHLPLHNGMLHFWMQAFGSGESTVRMMALVPGVLTIPAIYFLAKEFLDKNKALITMFFCAISPYAVWYSREIRMYALLALVSTLSYLFFVKLLKSNKIIFYAAYTLVNIVGIYTHYYFAFVLFSQVVFFFATWTSNELSENKWNNLIGLSISAGFLSLAFAPWLNILLNTEGTGSFGPNLTEPNGFNVILSFFEFTFGFQPDYLTSILIGLWPLFILLGFIFLTKRQDPFNDKIYLLLIGTLLPVTIIFLISKVYKPVYLTRYLTPSTPLFLVLLTWYLTEIKGKAKYILATLIACIMLYSLYNQRYHSDNPIKENYRDAIVYVNENATARDIIFISPPYNVYPFSYYYDGFAKVETIPQWDKRFGIPNATPELVESDTERIRKGHARMFLLISEDLENAEIVKTHFDLSYKKLDKQQFSKHLFVHVYQAEYN